MMPRIAALALVGLLGTAATVATAGPGETARANSHYKQGTGFLAQSLYAQALAEFQAAYELDPKPLLHYHMARAEEGAGHRQEALELYRRYLDEEPAGKGSDDARRHVVAITKDLVDHPPIAPPPPEPPKQDPPPPDDATTGTAKPFVKPPPPAPHDTAPAPHHRDWRFVGAGAVLLVAGVLLDTLPHSSSNKSLDALDFAPVAAYAGGATLVFVGVF